MNFKRALGMGALIWVFAFMVISIVMFLPWFKEGNLRVMIAWWVAEIPVVLLLAKWYFKQRRPNFKEGFLVGLVAISVGVVLDSIFTVPLFVQANYAEFYGNWTLYIGYAEFLVLSTLAGWEFDGPVAKTGGKTDVTESAVDKAQV